MDAASIILAVLVALAVIGQLCLPLVGRWSHKRQAADLARKRAHLLEVAADQQIQAFDRSSAKLKNDGKKDAND